MGKRSRAVLLVVAAAVMWGTYGSFVTAISARGMSGNVIVFLRFLATCIPVFLYLFFSDREKLRVKAKDLPLFLANGLASILFFTACYTAAIRETKIAVAAALLYTSPAMVMLLSAVLFREKLTARKCLCVALSVLGCALVSGMGRGGGGLTLRGLLLGLGSALGVRKGYPRTDPLVSFLFLYSIAALLTTRQGGDAVLSAVRSCPRAHGRTFQNRSHRGVQT